MDGTKSSFKLRGDKNRITRNHSYKMLLPFSSVIDPGYFHTKYKSTKYKVQKVRLREVSVKKQNKSPTMRTIQTWLRPSFIDFFAQIRLLK